VELASILTSLLILIATYLYVSSSEKSYVNVLTPTFAVLVPANYLLELWHVAQYGASNSTYAYVLSYAAYTVFIVGYAFGYVHLKVPALRLPFSPPDREAGRLAAYLVLAVSFALYLPVLLKFRELVANPREIYELTRTGYGLNFFISATLCYLALVLLLFTSRVKRTELTIFVVLCLGFVWLHGSKGQMLLVIFILAIYWVYGRGRRVSLPHFLVFTVALCALGIVSFLVTTPGLILEGVSGVAGYSEYTRNGMLVIDSDIGPLYGQLTLENQLYSRIPRVLFAEKPSDFGDFFLAEHFFPDAFARGQGAPAFGNGALFADFGPIALPLLLIAGLLNGALLKVFVSALRRHRGPGDFIMVLFASGTSIVPLVGVFLLPESLLLAVLANLLHCIRLRPGWDAQEATKRPL
jgi:hypothetical protein